MTDQPSTPSASSLTTADPEALPALVAFDLDDTLAPSKSPVPDPMAAALRALLDVVPVCVISGGQINQFRDQVLARIDATPAELTRLHLMPTCGTRYYRYEGPASGTADSDALAGWTLEYANDLTPEQITEGFAIVEREARRLGLWETETWGPVLEDRGSQITFSALGQEAPVDAKRAWDPTGEKKSALRDAVAPHLPELEVRSGGSTSVDITLKGVDKAYGMRRLAEVTGIALDDTLFVGDRLDPAGNDYPVKALGVPCHAVTGWEDTAAYVTELAARLAAARH
ncbi:HAD family hydrolase [Actinomyces radicidentis]|uniref:HAD family hydrolase n=1 Tax=Actinomyces radicidentis TaxID=111015 RepID=A0A0X8JG39_ACTRD|nr:HAD hydrolase family protein [Actinomyces radicidentis]AMD88185.1 HAD family hydrolase [Actinomyces radicidentis]